MKSTMKALRIEQKTDDTPSILSVEEVPIPSIRHGYILVRVRAAAIHASDEANARGSFAQTNSSRTPGRDFAGTIVDGPAHRIGEEVFGSGSPTAGFTTDGTHAEFCLIPEDLVYTKPRTLSFAQAATVGVPFLIAQACLRRARASRNDSVLILGAANQVGSAAAQICRAIGCRRIIKASLDGADINLTSDPYLQTLHTLTDGQDIDIALDTTGIATLWSSAVQRLARRGRLAWIPVPQGRGSANLTLNMAEVCEKDIELIGCNSLGQTIMEMSNDLEILKEWFQIGILQAKQEDELALMTLEEAVGATGRGYKDTSGKQGVVIIP